MSSTNTSRSNWRQRMAEKERREKEAIARAAEQERQKHAILNETNFPSNLVSTAHPVTHVFKLQGFANRAAEAERKDQQERTIQAYRQQRSQYTAMSDRMLASGIVGIHRKRASYTDEEEDEEELPQSLDTLNELYPRHRGRHYSTDPDAEGWREVLRYHRKKRVLTNAELERKARAEILGEDDDEDDEDMNGDLTDRNQRREFY